jgi:Helix-turn-helix domain/RodZ C-terminal domain
MPEIGATLREARMRARIDITEVEEATKIRAKYLRAIENEEWGLLPAPAFVKSFVREYADYLGLDARTLVEEYKLRHEGPSEHELVPISQKTRARERRIGGGGGGLPLPPRWAITGLLVLALLVALWALGTLGGSGSGGAGTTTPAGTSGGTATTPRHPARAAPATPAAEASVRVIATGSVYVCLVDQDGKALIRGATLSAGQQAPVHRARSMRLTLGNNAVRLRVNGRGVPVAPSAKAISLELTPTGARPLPAAKAPTCR